MTSPPGAEAVDPDSIQTREELAAALTGLRSHSGLTVREVVDRSGGLHGTVSGWFAGQHVPTRASEQMFRDVLTACGVSTPVDQDLWLRVVSKVRQVPGRRTEDGPVPYRGLESFHEGDSEWFFGRGELTEHLRARVIAAIDQPIGSRIVVIIGASGSGKSSLLRAGLIPAVHNAGIEAAVLVPGEHPLEALRAVPGSGGRSVVVIDQFEEAWTQCRDESERQEFMDSLAADNSRGGPVFVLGLRADFYAYAAQEPALIPALDAGPTIVGPLTTPALREAIVEPARKAGWTVDSDLVNLLLVELAPRGSRSAHDVGSLPLLSHALLGTWRRATRRRLTVDDYLATGGIGGAVEQSAEEVFGRLTDSQRSITRRIFLRLVNVEEESRTRRRVQRSELFFETSISDVNRVIDEFAASRLLTVEEESVAISHEVLIATWARLCEWVDGDRTGLMIHRRLTQASQIWEESGRDPSALLGPARLSLVREWTEVDDHHADLNQLECQFMTASIVHQDALSENERRRSRNLKRLLAALATISVIALVLAATALIARSNASEQRTAAEVARDEAMSRQVATEAIRLRDEDPALSAQLALAAYRVHPTPESRSALLDSTAIQTPIRIVGPSGRAVVATTATPIFADATADGIVTLRRLGENGSAPSELGRIMPGSEAPEVFSLAVTPDARILVVGRKARVEVWDISNPHAPTSTAAINKQGSVFQSVAITADGTRLFAGSNDGEIARWYLTDPKHPVALESLVQPGGSPMIAVSGDGNLLASAGQRASLRIWDTRLLPASTEPMYELASDGSTNHAAAVSFSPDGHTLAAAMRSAEVRRWQLDDAAHPVSLPSLGGFGSYVNDVSFSHDGKQLAAGSSDNTTRIWNLTTDSPEVVLPGPALVTSVRFAGPEPVLLTGSMDGTTRLWPLPGPVLGGARSTVFQNPFDGNGTHLLVGTGSKDKAAHLWDLRSPDSPIERPRLGVPEGDTITGAVAIARDGTMAAIGSASGHVNLWDIHDGAAPRELGQPIPAAQTLVAVIAFRPDGKLLAVSGQDDNLVTLWNLADPTAPTLVATIDARSLPQMLAFSPDGSLLAVGTAEDVVRLYDVSRPEGPTELTKLTGFENDALAVTFSPDGATLATGSADQKVRLFDIGDRTSPKLTTELNGPADAIYSLNFSSRGDRLAAGVGDGTIWVWDTSVPSTPSKFAVLTAYSKRVNDATFGDGGALLAAAGLDKVVRLWRTGVDSVGAALCSSGSTSLTASEWERYLPGVPARDLCGSGS